MAKPVGKRGEWFAVWEGQKLPCVHDCWTTFTREQGMTYNDPYLSENPKWGPFLKAIEEGRRVILTRDRMVDGQPSGRLSQDGYVAVWDVRDVVVANGALSFAYDTKVAEIRER